MIVMDDYFKSKIDDLIMLGESDPLMASALKWLDKIVQKENTTIYDKCLQLLNEKTGIDAETWNKTRYRYDPK